MVEMEILITNPSGLHTRPAKKIVDEAKKYSSEITLVKEARSGSAKNLIKLMKLGITLGNTIVVRCEGADETEALAAIAEEIARLAE